MNVPAAKVAMPRVAAGALFVNGDRVLLVRKTYGNRWDLPGGYVDIGESPRVACQREISEELNLARQPERLLVVDWAPSEKEGDKLLWVFDCGRLGDDEARIQLDAKELDHFEWVAVRDLDGYTIPRLGRRIRAAYEARREGVTRYLEHGEAALA